MKIFYVVVFRIKNRLRFIRIEIDVNLNISIFLPPLTLTQKWVL